MFSQTEIIDQARNLGTFTGLRCEYENLDLAYFVEYVEINAYDHNDHRHLVHQDGMTLVYENCRAHGCESRWTARTKSTLAKKCFAAFAAANAQQWTEHEARVAAQQAALGL